MMERLTKRSNTGRVLFSGDGSPLENANKIPLILERLAAYEDTGLEPEAMTAINDVMKRYIDAEAEGRLLVLPCKVGDTIYYLNPFGEIDDGKITMFQQKADGTWKFRVTTDFSRDVTTDAFGKTVFLSRDEAEAALKGGAE